MLKLGGFKYSKDVWLNNGCDQPLKQITVKITDFSPLSDTQVEAWCLFGRCALGYWSSGFTTGVTRWKADKNWRLLLTPEPNLQMSVWIAHISPGCALDRGDLISPAAAVGVPHRAEPAVQVKSDMQWAGAGALPGCVWRSELTQAMQTHLTAWDFGKGWPETWLAVLVFPLLCRHLQLKSVIFNFFLQLYRVFSVNLSKSSAQNWLYLAWHFT